ncbi:MAG: S8 family serine peptidase [Myxococcaceae bacterium]
MIGHYRASDLVTFVQPVYRPTLSLKPNDYDPAKQWEKEQLSAPSGWDTLRGSRAVTVAMVDTGIGLDHPDLLNNIAINQNEIPKRVRDWILDNPLTRDFDGEPDVISFGDFNGPPPKPGEKNINYDLCPRKRGGNPELCEPADLVGLDLEPPGPFAWVDGEDGVRLYDDLDQPVRDGSGQPVVIRDGNGLVDDFVGWDFSTCGLNDNQTDVLPGCGDNSPDDNDGHGTAVAGLIGADTHNGKGLAGTAWRVGLVPYKYSDSVSGIEGTNVHLVAAVREASRGDRALRHPIVTVASSATGHHKDTAVPESCSVQEDRVGKVEPYELFTEQESRIGAWAGVWEWELVDGWIPVPRRGSLIVAAVPNCELDFDAEATHAPDKVLPSPAGLLNSFNAIGVTSSNSSGDLVGARGRGDIGVVDFVAPGEELTVLAPGGGNALKSGTSLAVAQVAAAAALLISRDRGLAGEPHLLAAQLGRAADDNYEGKAGKGLLNLHKLSGSCESTPWTMIFNGERPTSWPAACWRPFSDSSPFNRKIPESAKGSDEANPSPVVNPCPDGREAGAARRCRSGSR